MLKFNHLIILSVFLVPIAPIIMQGRFQTRGNKGNHSLQTKTLCASSCLKKKHCHSFLLDDDSRCSRLKRGCQGRFGKKTCFLKIVPCVGQMNYSPSCTPEYLLVEDDRHIMHQVRGGRIHAMKMRWTIRKMCDMWSTAYDNFRYYWVCDDGLRLAFAHYNKLTIKIKGFLKFPTDGFRWFQVDGDLLFAVKWPESKFMYKFRMTSPSLKGLKKINKNRQSKGFYIDKTKKHIYWLNSFLRRTDYDGKSYTAYKEIRLKRFFMEFQGPVPSIYGINKKKIVKFRLGKRKGEILGSAPSPPSDCEAIFRTEDKTLTYSESFAFLIRSNTKEIKMYPLMPVTYFTLDLYQEDFGTWKKDGIFGRKFTVISNASFSISLDGGDSN